MKKRKTNDGFLDFHRQLSGKKFYFKSSRVPIFVLYWLGYDATSLIFNRTDIKVVKK